MPKTLNVGSSAFVSSPLLSRYRLCSFWLLAMPLAVNLNALLPSLHVGAELAGAVSPVRGQIVSCPA